MRSRTGPGYLVLTIGEIVGGPDVAALLTGLITDPNLRHEALAATAAMPVGNWTVVTLGMGQNAVVVRVTHRHGEEG